MTRRKTVPKKFAKPTPSKAALTLYAEKLAISEAENQRLASDYDVISSELRTTTGDLTTAKLRISAMSETLIGFDRLNEDANVIAMFYRENMRTAIESGYHQGRTLGEITIGYLTELQKLQAKLAALNASWFRRTFGL